MIVENKFTGRQIGKKQTKVRMLRKENVGTSVRKKNLKEKTIMTGKNKLREDEVKKVSLNFIKNDDNLELEDYTYYLAIMKPDNNIEIIYREEDGKIFSEKTRKVVKKENIKFIIDEYSIKESLGVNE